MLSIIIPVKKEPLDDVIRLIGIVREELRDYSHEFIMVHKFSFPSDLSNINLGNVYFIQQESDGLGNAILEGLKYSKGDRIVTMDSDFSHRPQDIKKLIREDSDIIIGSRYIDGGRNKDKPYRVMVSKVFCGLASLVLGLDIKDSMSGFSVIKKKVYEKLKLGPIGPKINTEILYKAKNNFSIKETPITFFPRQYGKSKIGFLEGLKTLFFIFALKLGLR